MIIIFTVIILADGGHHNVLFHSNKCFMAFKDTVTKKNEQATSAEMRGTHPGSLQPLHIFILHNVALQLYYSYKFMMPFGFVQ